MKMPVEQWLKNLRYPTLRSAYTVGASAKHVAERYGLTAHEMVKLNFNENLFIPREKLIEYLREVAQDLDPRLYPQDEERELKKRFADYVKVSPESLVIGNGSDELVARIAQILVRKGEQVILTTPTFPFYKHSMSLMSVDYVEVPLRKDFSLDRRGISAKTSSRTRLLYVCSPNNPTANQFSLNEVESLIGDFPGIVVVDEAYVQYADYSTVSLLDRYENLVVLRTFSKAFGLAGFRLGCAVTGSYLAGFLSANSPVIFPVSGLALRMALKMLEHVDVVDEGVKNLKEERSILIDELNKLSEVKAFESKTNFVLFQVERESTAVQEALQAQGVLVKNLGQILHLDNCLRATVGLPQMNNRMLTALRECLKK